MYTEKFIHQMGINTLSIASTGDSAGVACGAVPQTWTMLTYTVRVANTDAAVIKFDKIPANAGSRGDGDVGVLNIPANPTVGKTYYKTISINLVPGDVVVAEVTDAGASGSGHINVYGFFSPDVPANQTHMIAST